MRRHNTHIVSTALSYTVDEICHLFKTYSLAKSTVQQWIKDGLPICCTDIPALIQGSDLIEFLDKRNAIMRGKTNFEEFYCVSCRKKHIPKNQTILLEHHSNFLKAFCTCPIHTKRKLFKCYKLTDLEKLSSFFAIQHDKRLGDSATTPRQVAPVNIDQNNKPDGTLKRNTVLETNKRNERTKYNYRIYLANVKGANHKTWITIIRSIQSFEKYNNFADFSKISAPIISSYINNLVANKSLSHCDRSIRSLRDFYLWLERQKEYRDLIDYNLLGYFQLTNNQRKTARATEYQESYDLDEIRRAISAMPTDGFIICILAPVID